MDYFYQKSQLLSFQRLTSFCVILSFLISFMTTPQVVAESALNLPSPGEMMSVSVPYHPAIIHGMTLHPDDPFFFDFIIHPGDDQIQGEVFKEESMKLIKYFMAALTVPDDEMWVNLSPYEKDRIIPKDLGRTDMGRDLLAQDYLLKQLTVSLMNPDDQLGSEFWKRVYARVYEEYGTTDVPMNTFNKVWIIPAKAILFQNGPHVFVVESRFKVMLEEDYLALDVNVQSDKHGLGDISEDKLKKLSEVSSKVIKEIILPEIEREVNEGKTFANLRQISNSVILAHWYKQNIKQSLLNQAYINQNKTNGIDIQDKEVMQKIYEQYVEAFEKGVIGSIKEEYDSVTQGIVFRQYFSGGINLAENNLAMMAESSDGGAMADVLSERSSVVETSFVISSGVKVDDPFFLAEYLREFAESEQPTFAELLNFSIVGDTYNISAPVEVVLGLDGRKTEMKKVIAARVDQRDGEHNTKSMFCEQNGRGWHQIEGTPVFDLQDPFITTIIDPVTGEEEIIFGGVKVWAVSPVETHWSTVFYRGKTLNDLDPAKPFTESALMMKDVRITQLRDGKILVGYRSPQGGKESGYIYRDQGLPLLGFAVLDSIDDFPAFINDKTELPKHLISEIFEKAIWGGINAMYLLEDGRIGILAHIASKDDTKPSYRHYYPMSFILDSKDMSVTESKIILTVDSLSQWLLLSEIPSKAWDLEDVIFSGGLIYDEDSGQTFFYGGMRDTVAPKATIHYPFGNAKMKPYQFDNAPLVESVGGIDMNPNIAQAESRGQAEGFIFEFNSGNVTMPFKGLTPAILKISPVSNIPVLLGEASK